MQALIDHWRDVYDWRRCEAMLNGFGQHRTEIDGLGVHFLHIRSLEPDALSLLMTHGWPGSVLEFHMLYWLPTLARLHWEAMSSIPVRRPRTPCRRPPR